MQIVAVPINDARDAQWASKQVIDLYRREAVRIHLVNVQHPLSRHISQFLNVSEIQAFHRDAGMHVLEPAIRALNAAGVPHIDHVLVGHKVDAVVRFAQEYSCNQVLLKNDSEGLLSVLGLGSIASQIRRAIAGGAAKVRPS